MLEVYAVHEDKAKLCSELADPGKFRTLDTKLLAALTKVAKGELAQQILNYSESEAQQGRIVRGRQVLCLKSISKLPKKRVHFMVLKTSSRSHLIVMT